jgi:hypothetical protein
VGGNVTSTPAPSFEAVIADFMRLLQGGAYGKAQRLLAEHGARFPDRAPMYLRSCAAARLDQPEQAVRVLHAAAEQGFWYGERVLPETHPSNRCRACRRSRRWSRCSARGMLRRDYDLDEDRSIIAGFSMGGEMALRLALDGSVPVHGFILLAPSGPPDQGEWLPPLRHATPHLRGYVILGADDGAVSDEPIQALVDQLNDNGIPCGFEILTGVGHEYPPDLASPARRALDFIDT